MNCKLQGKVLEPNPTPFDVKRECVFCPQQMGSGKSKLCAQSVILRQVSCSSKSISMQL